MQADLVVRVGGWELVGTLPDAGQVGDRVEVIKLLDELFLGDRRHKFTDGVIDARGRWVGLSIVAHGMGFLNESNQPALGLGCYGT